MGKADLVGFSLNSRYSGNLVKQGSFCQDVKAFDANLHGVGSCEDLLGQNGVKNDLFGLRLCFWKNH